jgi:MFS family permease
MINWTDRRTKVALGTLVGTTIEWYDFYIYGIAAALIFGPKFFPRLSPLMGTIAAFATFGVGFVARPLGGAVFGYIGDRFGRKGALVATLLIMGICTFFVGLVPVYNSIGIAAPILLVILRLIQGVAVGGEWGGAVLMATEHAPLGRRGIYAAWPQLGSGAGLLISNGVFLAVRMGMSEGAFREWGWRIPFLFSVVLVIVGLLIRLKVEESPVFTKMQIAGKTRNNPLLHVFKSAPKTLLLTACVFLLNNTVLYIISTFALSYLAKMGVAGSVGLTGVMIGAFMLCIFTIIFSYLSDFYGRKRIIASVYSVWFIMAFLFFYLLQTKDTMLIYLGFGAATLLTAAYGPIGSFIPEQFNSDVRYSGVSISVQIASIVAGGTGPMVSTMLNAAYGIRAVSIYIIVIAVISVGAVLILPETYKADVDKSIMGASVGA